MKKTGLASTAVLLALSLAACSSGGDKNASSSPSASGSSQNPSASASSAPNKDAYKIDVFSMLSNFSGEQQGWFAKVVKDKFNLDLNIISSNLEGGGDVKFSAMMSAGSLGELVVFGDDGQKYLDAIKTGMLLDWTQDGLLDKYGQNILKYAPKAIEKNKANFGGGSKVYGIGFDVGEDKAGPSEAKDLTYHPNLRFDLYQKAGSPVIKTMEDYLPVLKKMQELEPKSDSGRPTYAFSMWQDWDGNMMMNTKAWAGLNGFDEGDGFNPGGFTLISADKDEMQGVLDEDGFYMRGLKLYYDANQMGLVDPDSLTQKFDDVTNKMKDGQILFTWFPWLNTYNTPERLAEGKGFALVPFQEERTFSYGFNPYGGNRVWAIGAKAKHPERIMEFLDWLYSPEGTTVANYGPEGLAWKLEGGKQVLTDFGKEALPSNTTPVPAEYGGGTWRDGSNQINNSTFKITSINPETGEPYDYNLWSSTLAQAPNKLEENWRAAMGGATTAKEYLEKNNLLAVEKQIFTGTAPTVMPDDLTQKQGQVAQVIKQYSWKMVFAKNDAEFEKLKKEMIAKAKGLGYDDVLAFNKEQNEKVFAYRKQ
ncbi:extracellular solute-binding protein [Cohnella nanjingensis]|uniref:ABC transporter substrate-binding protein n=1 Tax=Cohnella nanjingensis TaxID=1387779 RepID=A0A7X0RT67_9BACL|nr:extracellular solute-binding protein [Cohnella nanjingensis]MBB6673248.1 ABC transporter substrate-binding protein [Cohnella nanjingensis]